MLSRNEILQTIDMIDQQHLDIRTITMGISLLSCCNSNPVEACRKIYDKICRHAERLVSTGEQIELKFGIPIVNKRISVTPMALVAAASDTSDYVPFAQAMDRAAKTCGVNFIGGYSALVQKGMTDGGNRKPSHPFRKHWPAPSTSAPLSTWCHPGRPQHGRRAAHGGDGEKDRLAHR